MRSRNEASGLGVRSRTAHFGQNKNSEKRQRLILLGGVLLDAGASGSPNEASMVNFQKVSL